MDKSPKKRLTIGLLTEGLDVLSSYTSIVASGVMDAAEKHNVNLLVIPGGNLSISTFQESISIQPRELLYDLVSPENVDGLVIMGSLGSFGAAQDLIDFHKRYHPVPTVSIGTPIEGIASIVVDNEQGLYNAISHLIEVHHAQRIAFIRGPEAVPEAQMRYQVYTRVLADHGLPLDITLVASGNFSEDAGEAAIKLWLDERQVSFDAVVAANDIMALAAMRELQTRNISVPGQVAVVGFDDDGGSQVSIPSLTTVRQPMAGLGEQAVITLLEKLNGKAAPELVTLPTEAVIRQSCGCWDPLVQQAANPTIGESRQRGKLSKSQADLALAAMQQALATTENLPPGWAQELLASFQSEIEGLADGAFLGTLDRLLRQAAKTKSAIGQWQGVISALSHFTRSTLRNEQLSKAETLWHQGRVSIQEITRKSQARAHMQEMQQQALFQLVSQRLVTTINLEKLMDVIAHELPALGIKSGYLVLYDEFNPKGGLPERSRMLMAYNTASPITPLAPGGNDFLTRDVVPAGFLPNERFTLILEPLYFQDRQFGFACFDMSLQGPFYEQLRGQISSALQGATLVQRVEERAVQIQTAADVSRAASSIMEADNLVKQTVELIRERFNLYYVGLFLVDQTGEWTGEPNRWAVLRAGSGEEGQRLLDRNHKLEVGGESMIGWCVTNQQARIALDVGQDAVRFNNPLLPETHSEAALPLLSRGKAIGALTIQSTREAAFTSEDITVLQTMADQLSNAIENANLFGQVQKRAIELNKARELAEKAREEAESARVEAEKAREEAEKARRDTEAANRSLAAQMWMTTGQALLNDRMRGEQDLQTLGSNVIQQLCKYLDARSGALYIVENDSLQLTGTYAFKRKNLGKQFQMGEDLVGQAALGQEAITVQAPDEQVIAVSAALGEMLPKFTQVVPFLYDGKSIGVVRFETFTEFSPAQKEFLNQSLENVAISFTTAQARSRVNELYTKTRQQAEELQAQEEELRATNEELEAQTENLRASETRLKANQTALEAANVDLEEKTHNLQEKQAVLDRQNQVLREAQQELERKAEELTITNKYKSEFLANMSHELRTPLNSLLILSRMFANNDGGNLTPDQVESAQVIYNSGSDLLNLINEILDLSKVEAGRMTFHFEPMPLESLAGNMRLQFTHVAEERNLAFEVNLAAGLPENIETDQQRVEQIIKNLLSNAFKFTEKGMVRLLIEPADEMIAIRVQDSGIGMTPDQQQRVFEAFQQADGSTSRKYGGTGLGLTISREMAAKLDGKIGLESEPGKGSTFTLYLPIKPVEREAEPAPAPASVSVAASKAEVLPVPSAPKVSAASDTIPSPPAFPDDRAQIKKGDKVLLIIEDDASFAKVLFDYAHKKAFKCLLSGDGESGLKLATLNHPDAILLDLKLPGISGWEVLDALKNDASLRHIPVHILSASEETMDAYQRGALGFLSKPLNQEDLENVFGKIGEFLARGIKSLLLVEDDSNLRFSVRQLLGGSDVKITEAASGDAAIALLRENRFDCMILDLTLPDMTGFELLSQINSDDSMAKCPVIVYTGKALTEEENAQLLKYADSVIIKGVKSPERLMDETALFLHRVVADMPAEKRETIRRLHDRNAVFNGKHVLVVDDDMRNAFALSRLLNDRDLRVTIARSGAKALELLESTPDIDLVLMDIMMPEMDGYETMQKVRAQQKFKNLPILALTAKAMKGDMEKCIASGANDYLSKPIDAERLFSMLRVWLYR